MKEKEVICVEDEKDDGLLTDKELESLLREVNNIVNEVFKWCEQERTKISNSKERF